MFKPNQKVRVIGSADAGTFTVIEERPEYVATYWNHPTFGRLFANLPANILEEVPALLPVGTVIRDGEDDLWVAIKPGRYANLTVDGYPNDGIDVDDLESLDFIELEYGGDATVLFNPEA